MDKCVGDINSKKSMIDSFAKRGDEKQMGNYIQQLEKILESNASILGSGKGADLKADALAAIQKGKDTCNAELNKQKVTKVTSGLASKKSMAESFAARKDTASVEKYTKEAEKLLEENKDALADAAGQKIVSEANAWIATCRGKLDASNVTDMDIRGIKGDVNRITNWMVPGRVDDKALQKHIDDSEKLLKEKANVLDHNADTKAAKQQLETCLATAKKHLESKEAAAAAPKATTTTTTTSTATAAAPAPAPAAASAPAAAVNEREILSQINRVSSSLGGSQPRTLMEYNGPPALVAKIEEGKGLLAKYEAQKGASPQLTKAYDELTKNIENAQTIYNSEKGEHEAVFNERNAMEEQFQKQALQPKTVAIRNDDKVKHPVEIKGTMATGATYSSKMDIQPNRIQNNMCNPGNTIILYTAKPAASIVVREGCTTVTIKNGALSCS